MKTVKGVSLLATGAAVLLLGMLFFLRSLSPADFALAGWILDALFVAPIFVMWLIFSPWHKIVVAAFGAVIIGLLYLLGACIGLDWLVPLGVHPAITEQPAATPYYPMVGASIAALMVWCWMPYGIIEEQPTIAARWRAAGYFMLGLVTFVIVLLGGYRVVDFLF